MRASSIISQRFAMDRSRSPGCLPRIGLAFAAVLASGGAAVGQVPAAQPPTTAPAPRLPGTPAAAAPAAPEVLDLETSDGVRLQAWLYRAASDTNAPAAPGSRRGTVRTTVILLHDLGGSHAGVEPLARILQRGGCHVIAPDLRGHGESTRRRAAGPRGDDLDAKQFKRADLEAIASSTGGSVRDQADGRGDVETVRAFLRDQSEPGGPGLDRLVVVGVGAGASVAALWTAADAAWPPIATGPQGAQVRALVLVSPQWAPRGLTILPALNQDTVKKELPVLVVGGKGDRDAVRVYDHFKRHRPQDWFEQRVGQRPASAPKLERPVDARTVLLQVDSDESAEKLLAVRRGEAGELVRGFLGAVLDAKAPGGERP